MEDLLKSLTWKKLDDVAHGGKELNLDSACKYIVIGSGMGGGMVTRQLIEKGKTVTLFERGGLPFSTHCLNTSRPHFNTRSKDSPGRDNEVLFQDKELRQTINTQGKTVQVDRKPIRIPYEVQKETAKKEDRKDVSNGGSVFALGGRSLLWSLEAPEMDLETARRYFPQDVIDYLYGLAGPRTAAWESPNEKESGYTKAIRIMANSPPGDPQYPLSQLMSDHLPTVEFPINLRQPGITRQTALSATDETVANLRKVEQLNDSDIFPTPIGAEFTKGNKLHYFPQSAYSTVDYLLHQGLDPDSLLNLFVDVQVFKLEVKDGKITKLVLRYKDHKNHEHERVVNVQERTVILCAGTVETAAIARRSELENKLSNSLIGQGLTDHEIWMSRYWKEYTQDEIKQDPQPVELSCYVSVHGNQALLTICTHAEKFFSHDFADGSGLLKAKGRPPANCLNIMLELNAELNNDGEVNCKTEKAPTVKIARKSLDESQEFKDSLRKLSKDIRRELGFTRDFGSTVVEDMPALQGFGAVAHEVGTMRMGRDETSDDEDEEGSNSDAAGVVDENLKVHNLDNLYVCDLSVFPFSPAANPSLTLTALAMRLGDHLTK
ncbi:hypothetical protein BFW01_g1917 [Lasiodiplodia theobromae]|nr:hypothetical protein BFW01_g1917 [Lasiodiplodia theobromae]